MAYYYFNYWVNRSGRRNTQILLPKKANLNDKNLLKIIKEYTSNRPGIKKVIGVFFNLFRWVPIIPHFFTKIFKQIIRNLYTLPYPYLQVS